MEGVQGREAGGVRVDEALRLRTALELGEGKAWGETTNTPDSPSQAPVKTRRAGACVRNSETQTVFASSRAAFSQRSLSVEACPCIAVGVPKQRH
jgi:hypothetical protein